MRPAMRLGDVGAHGNSARFRVLNNSHGRIGVVIRSAQSRVAVNVVVERHFFAVQLDRAGYSTGFGFSIQRRALMRVFAIAQHVGALPNPSGERREGDGDGLVSGGVLNFIGRNLLAEPGGYRQVIASGVFKSGSSQRAAFSEGEAFTLGGSDDVLVASRIDHDCD